METDLLKNKIMSTEQRIGQLRATERIFLERATHDGEASRAKLRVEERRAKLETLKARMAEMTAARDAIINQAISDMVVRLEAALPVGQPLVAVESGRVDIGLVVDGVRRPYRALSGGERISFDLAMAAAMGAQLIIKEASELDSERLADTMERLDHASPQVLLVSCHEPFFSDRYQGWTRCETPVSKSQ